mgnify:CR=1 FL=1|tara:strand:- start:114 stop:416 length:303 start_codon:yes stop_codon:yes gene_type:complete
MNFSVSKAAQLMLGLVGLGLLLIALLFLSAAGLGMLGILADTSREENFEWGMKALRGSVISVVLSIPALLLLYIIRRMRSRTLTRDEAPAPPASAPNPPE